MQVASEVQAPNSKHTGRDQAEAVRETMKRPQHQLLESARGSLISYNLVHADIELLRHCSKVE